jgi:hypothetical protein
VKNLPKAITVSSVTITTVSVKCDRCRSTASGTCSYPNHAMFVQRELKYVTISVNRTTKSNYPKEVVICPDCAGELESMFATV